MIDRNPLATRYNNTEVEARLSAPARHQVNSMLTYTAIGTGSEVRGYLSAFAERTGVDELVVVFPALSLENRLRSLELTAEVMEIAQA